MPPERKETNVAARWLILADDLTGAADCAIAFARQGIASAVGWGDLRRLRRGSGLPCSPMTPTAVA